MQVVERHISRCGDARRVRDWKSVLKEADAAISAGADSSPQARAIQIFFLIANFDFIVIENRKN